MDVICTGAQCIIENSVTIPVGLPEYNINFSFNEEWDTLNKQVHFFINTENYIVQLLSNICSVPIEILNQKGHLYLGVVGTLPDLDPIFPDETKVLTTKRVFAFSLRQPQII